MSDQQRIPPGTGKKVNTMPKKYVCVVFIVMRYKDYIRSKFKKDMRMIATYDDSVIAVPARDLDIDQLGLPRIYGRRLNIDNNKVGVFIMKVDEGPELGGLH
jgi:hypothetical protein